MPEADYSTASTRTSRAQRAADNDYKSTSQPKQNEAKSEPGGSFPLHAESKLGQQEGAQGRMLRSLQGSTKRPGAGPHHHDSPTFASLPSPSAEAGKLAPLELGQCSPRSARHRLSIRSNSPDGKGSPSKDRHRDSSEAETYCRRSRSGSCTSPRNMSPRLPAMKSPPSPRADGALPEIVSIGGAHSARRVRSLSPRRVSGAEAISPIRPDGGMSCLPDAGPKAHGSRRGNGVMGGEGLGRRRDSSEEKGRSAVETGLRACHGEGSEEKGEPGPPRFSESKSHSPPRVKVDRRLSDEVRPTGNIPTTPQGRLNASLGSGFDSPGKRAIRPNLEDVPAVARRSTRKEDQDMQSAMAASTSKLTLAPVGGGGVHGREEKEGGTPNGPSGDRGESGNLSPRTRRMRSPADSTR